MTTEIVYEWADPELKNDKLPFPYSFIDQLVRDMIEDVGTKVLSLDHSSSKILSCSPSSSISCVEFGNSTITSITISLASIFVGDCKGHVYAIDYYEPHVIGSWDSGNKQPITKFATSRCDNESFYVALSIGSLLYLLNWSIINRFFTLNGRFTLESEISDILISSDGNIMIVCLNSGEILGYNLSSLFIDSGIHEKKTESKADIDVKDITKNDSILNLSISPGSQVLAHILEHISHGTNKKDYSLIYTEIGGFIIYRSSILLNENNIIENKDDIKSKSKSKEERIEENLTCFQWFIPSSASSSALDSNSNLIAIGLQNGNIITIDSNIPVFRSIFSSSGVPIECISFTNSADTLLLLVSNSDGDLHAYNPETSELLYTCRLVIPSIPSSIYSQPDIPLGYIHCKNGQICTFDIMEGTLLGVFNESNKKDATLFTSMTPSISTSKVITFDPNNQKLLIYKQEDILCSLCPLIASSCASLRSHRLYRETKKAFTRMHQDGTIDTPSSASSFGSPCWSPLSEKPSIKFLSLSHFNKKSSPTKQVTQTEKRHQDLQGRLHQRIRKREAIRHRISEQQSHVHISIEKQLHQK